jgi:hypothetical protein
MMNPWLELELLHYAQLRITTLELNCSAVVLL